MEKAILCYFILIQLSVFGNAKSFSEAHLPGSSLAEVFLCPEPDGFFPVSITDKCTANFFKCVKGTAYPETCPSGHGPLVFDPKARRCMSEDNATCKGLVAEKVKLLPTLPTLPTQATTTGPSPPFKCLSDGFFAIPDKCTADYYNCVDGTPYTQTCPGNGTVFDPQYHMCKTLENATCFPCPKPDGFFAIPGKCVPEYYVCVNSIVTNDTCPPSYIFDPEYGECTSEDKATCNTGKLKCPEPSGRFPFPNDCSPNFFVCINSVPFNDTCPGNSIFDHVESVCKVGGNCGNVTASPSSYIGKQRVVLTVLDFDEE